MIKIYGIFTIGPDKTIQPVVEKVLFQAVLLRTLHIFSIMKNLFVTALLIAGPLCVNAQDLPDSVRLLEPFTVQGYLYNRSLSEAPASLGILSEAELERFNNTTILPAINTIPGVRMEERSPGSFRLSLRGSSIRSPFGVRNVKVYWNGLPFTDGGGNTYLNLFDFSTVNRIEVIKGPGGSLYGAGTGGVVLLNSRAKSSPGVEVSALAGSFGLRRYQVRGDFSGDNMNVIFNYGRLDSQGYRDQSKVRRDAANLEIQYSPSPSTAISANVLFTDIFYETPGGLTWDQFRENPRQARQPAGIFGGAEEQNARVNNQALYTGLSVNHSWTKQLESNIGFYYSHSDFENYAIANYELRDEANAGLRTENSLSFSTSSLKGKISFGGEFQSMTSPIDVRENNGGVIGALLITDDLDSRQAIVFAQAELDLPRKFFLTAGFSESWVTYKFRRAYPEQQNVAKRFDAVFSPRIALLKKFGKISAYASASRGFSPPTLAEVRPSTNAFNSNLFPEKGINYEGGLRGTLGRFTFDLTEYFFFLKETIILDRVENGAEYFVNAGRTKQIGTELTASWKFSDQLKTWLSFSFNDYQFEEYGDFSGNDLTGVPRKTALLGLDYQMRNGIYFNGVYSYTDEIPLDDANQVYSEDYFLLNVRVGFRKSFREKYRIDIFGTVDNAFDERYSLGNDLNARGMRFYNAAPERNYAIGVKFQIL